MNTPLNGVARFRDTFDDYLVYSSHNIDSSHDRDALQTLFTTWVDYIPTVLEILGEAKTGASE